MGGFFSTGGWAFIFFLGSPSIHGKNVPLYSLQQILTLAGLGISSVLGLAGAIISKKKAPIGGIVMLVAAGIALTSFSSVFLGGLVFLFLLPTYFWWAIVLFLGGLSGAVTRTPQDAKPAVPTGSATVSKAA